MSDGILLIQPPGARICEPPAGLSRLAGYCAAAGRPVRILDLGLESFFQAVNSDFSPQDPWTGQAWSLRFRHIRQLTMPGGYSNFSAYTKAVHDLNRILHRISRPRQAIAGLANFSDNRLSPLRRDDLLRAYEYPDENYFYPLFTAKIPELMTADGMADIGVSISYLSQALTAFSILGWLKKNKTGITTWLGGSLVNCWLEAGIFSPKELGHAADRLIHGDARQEPFLPVQAKDLPAPPFFQFDPEKPYLSPGRVFPYNISQGCSWKKCTFCTESMNTRPYSKIADQLVRLELSTLSQQNPSLLHITDNETDPQFLELMISETANIPWYGFCRFLPQLTDPLFCLELRRSGCVMLQLGLESGDRKVLETMRKGIHLRQVEKILENLKQAGIKTFVYMLFGTPGEDEKSAQNSLDFLKTCAGAITCLNISLFNLPVHSPQARQLATSPFYQGDLDVYKNFRHPLNWDRPRVRHFIQNRLEKDEGIRTILNRTPPVFTSSHAPFFSHL